MKWLVRIVLAVVVVALLAGIVNVLRPRPFEVDAVEVKTAPFEQIVVNDGVARVRERYTVSAPVAGTLARIELHEGDAVAPGAVLARLLPLPSPLLDPRSRAVAERRLAAAVDGQRQSEATVERAAAAADQSRRELDRTKALAGQAAVTASELDRATAEARVRDAELASARFAGQVARHGIEQARAALATFSPGASRAVPFEVTAPVHGVVLHVLHQSEGAVTPGEPLLELGDPAALELAVDVLSQDAVSIRPGMTARVPYWGGVRPLTAKVRRVEPSAFTKVSALGVQEHRVNVLLDLDDPPERWQGLGDGFAVEVEIVVWSQPAVLQAPTSALYRDGEGWAVFAVVDGHVRSRRVEVGHRGPLEAEIVRGLTAGELVVVHPGSGLHDGVAVTHR